MPLKTLQYELSNWQGMDRWTPETECDPHWWYDIANFEFDDAGVTAKRRGAVGVGFTLSGSINMIYDFQSQQGFSSATDNQRTIIVAGGTLSVIKGFNTASYAIESTFSVSNCVHHAITNDLGVCFVSNENGGAIKMLCYVDGAWVYQDANFVAPAAIATAAGGATGTTMSGTFQAIYAYVDIYGNESPQSPESTPIVLSNQALSIVVTASTDPTVDYIKLYVLGPAMSDYQFSGTVSNVSGTYSHSMSMSDLMAGDYPPEYLVAAPNGKFLTIYEDMLLVGGDPVVPDTVWCSNRQFHRQFSDNFARCVSGDGQPIRGFGGSYDRSMVVKADSLFVCEGSHQDDFKTRLYSSQYGAVGQSAIALADNALAFFYDDGFYVDNGQVPQEVSRKVLSYLRTLDWRNIIPYQSTPSRLVVGNYKYYRQAFIATKEYEVGSDQGENDVLLIWNYLRNTWTKFTGNVPRCLAAVQNSDDYEYLFGGDVSGNLWVYSAPNVSTNDDSVSGSTASTTISCYAETPWMNFAKLLKAPDWERTRTIPRYIEVYASGEPASGESTVNLDCSYYVDFDRDNVVNSFQLEFPAHAWPTVRPYKQTIYYGGRVGTFRWVKWRFEHAYLGQSMRIHKIVFGFKLKPSVD